ncbi:MAG: alpha/beta hydrolase [Pseudomonadota bacterium]
MPIRYGPFKGQARRENSIIKLLDTTTLLKDYEQVAGMTLEAIQKIRRPTLALYGDKSHFLITYEYLRDTVPGCTTVLVPDGDHYGPLEHPETVVEHLMRFLKSNNDLPGEA